MDAASRVISRSQDSALGKKPDTAVQTKVSVTAQAPAAVLPPPDEYGRILRGILDRDI